MDPVLSSFTALASLDAVAMRPVTDELVEQVAQDLRERYALDGEDVRVLGERLAGLDRRAANRAFAERFPAAHAETFDRLGQ